MICNFKSIVFQSYQDNEGGGGSMILKCCVQWNPVSGSEDSYNMKAVTKNIA